MQSRVESNPPRRHRSLFLSDLHLGAVGARVDLLLDFLNHNRAETYVLAGDILDLWLPVIRHWTPAHQAVIAHFRARHAEGAKILYVRGNHDPDPASAPPDRQLPVSARTTLIHEAADGRRYLVIHGDIADGRILRSHIMTRFGSWLDNLLRRLDRPRSDARPSMIARLLSVSNTVLSGRGFRLRLIALARGHGADGVICGHSHISALERVGGLTYANCGDWLDSCTALAEDFNGSLSLLTGLPVMVPQPLPGTSDGVPA